MNEWMNEWMYEWNVYSLMSDNFYKWEQWWLMVGGHVFIKCIVIQNKVACAMQCIKINVNADQTWVVNQINYC